MSGAPERIWIHEPGNGSPSDIWFFTYGDSAGCVEYIRADLAGLPGELAKRLDAAVAVVDDETAQRNWPYVEKLLRDIRRWHEQQQKGEKE
jgi:hypothetical protein